MREADVRNALNEYEIDKIKMDDPTTIVIDELGLLQGDHRIDVAIVNGYLHGYEIKSASDTLERLPAQVQCYNKIFDKVTLVVSERHAEKATELIPDWWGILIATGRKKTTLSKSRRPQPNKNVDAYSLSQLLWKDEVISILFSKGLPKKIQSQPRRVLWQELIQCTDIQELSELVRQALKSRVGWRAVP